MKNARCVGLVVLALMSIVFPHRTLSAQGVVSLRGGVSSATYRLQDFRLDLDRRTGFAVGASWSVPLSSWAGLFVGGMYVQKGFEEEFGGSHYVSATDYLDIPVLLQATIVSRESFSGHLRLGPTISVKVGCNRVEVGRRATTTNPCDESIRPLRSVDYLATGGAGVNAHATDAVVWSLDAFYSFGLRSIHEGAFDFRNEAVRVEAGIGVVLGR